MNRRSTPYYSRSNVPYGERLVDEEADEYEESEGDESESLDNTPLRRSEVAGQGDVTRRRTRFASASPRNQAGPTFLNLRPLRNTVPGTATAVTPQPLTPSGIVPPADIPQPGRQTQDAPDVLANLTPTPAISPDSRAALYLNATPDSRRLNRRGRRATSRDDFLVQDEGNAVVAATSAAKKTYGISEEAASYASVDRTKQASSTRSVRFGAGTSVGEVRPKASSFATMPLTGSVGGQRRTIENVSGFSKKIKQVLPPESYDLNILGVAYTVIRFVGYTESNALTLMVDAHRARYGQDWNKTPIDLPVTECGSAENLPALVNYTDSLFAAYAYQMCAVAVLSMEQLVCYLQSVSADSVPVDAKAVLNRMLVLVDPGDLSSLVMFVNSLETFRQYFSFGGVDHSRILYAVKTATSKSLLVFGFSEVALALLQVGTWPDNEYWREEVINCLGAALASNTGLGGETVTGALVQKLLGPALRYIADSEDDGGLRQVEVEDIDAVRSLVDEVSEYLTTLRIQQSAQVVDLRISELLFLWCMLRAPLDVEVIKGVQAGSKKCSSQRYADLCIAELPNQTRDCNVAPPLPSATNQLATLLMDEQQKRNSTMYYAEKSNFSYVDPNTCAPVVTQKTEIVSGISSFLDGWQSLVMRPKTQNEAAQLRQWFAPNDLLSGCATSVPGETPYKFRLDRDSLVRTLLTNPFLFADAMKPCGVLQGFVPIGQL